MWNNNFFYVIVGGGMAGLQLAREFSRDVFFKGKQIAIIDPSLKAGSNKTWCFWEEGKGKWDDIISAQWETGRFISKEVDLELELSPYKYKMLKSNDFYHRVKEELAASGDFHFIEDEISKIDPVKMAAIGTATSYTATHFFDSRVSADYLQNAASTKIFQHFKGLVIETENSKFDTSEFTMMDYRMKFKNSTSFTYFLPITETKALVEFTFFTPFLTEEAVYDEYLEKYTREVLKIDNYKISETEKGIIPMTDFPFHKENNSEITKIGTGGGWVKGSTGYSFKQTEKKVAALIENIHAGKEPGYRLLKKRFRFYDAIFLDVLDQNNELGEDIFTKFYTKNSPLEIFKYLDEETNTSEELKIMLSLYHPQFLKSFFRKIFRKKD